MQNRFTYIFLCLVFIGSYTNSIAQTPTPTPTPTPTSTSAVITPPKVLSWDEYQQLVNNNLPVLVDFTTTWCNPCKMLHPVMEDVAKDMKGKMIVIYMDADAQRALLGQAGVSEYPTLLLYKKGKLAWHTEGYMPKDMLMKELKERL